ncbi:ABC transporter permease [Candidatus Woesearchaeota archaeon]|nr:ABC transporter permease [Candidatus Woesearchaeota archaeon]
MVTDYLLLAARNIRRRGIRSWLTMLGIFLGIAAVVSLISLGSGLQQAVTGQFGALDADKLVIENLGAGFGPPGSTAVAKLTNHDFKLVQNTAGVELAVKRYIRPMQAVYNGVAVFGSAASLPDSPKELQLVYDFLDAEPLQGRLLEETSRGQVILGSHYLEEDHFGKPLAIGKTILIQNQEFKVAGILKRSSNFMVNHLILMPEKDLRQILRIGNEIDFIAAQVSDQNQLPSVAQRLEQAFRKDRRQKIGEEDFSIQTPQQSLSAVNTILTIINIIVSGIAAISLLIGGMGIANTMYTSILERTKEIGIMKAVGAKRRIILLIFLLESGLLGLIGGIVGVIIGLLLASGIAGIVSQAPGGIQLIMRFSWPWILAAIGFSLFLGMISGIFPAWQAAKLPPVEALRK